MINSEHLRLHVIRPTLKYMGMWSESAENLLLGTAAQESLMGTYLTQINGPALGIYQIEPDTENDVWENYLEYREPLMETVRDLMPAATKATTGVIDLVGSLPYSTAIARLVYFRRPEPLPAPNDIQGLANYWKDHFNTHRGKGKPEEFVEKYHQIVLATKHRTSN